MWFLRKRELSEQGRLVKNLLDRDGWFLKNSGIRGVSSIANEKMAIEITPTCGEISVYFNNRNSSYNKFTKYDNKKLLKLVLNKTKKLKKQREDGELDLLKKQLKLCLKNNS